VTAAITQADSYLDPAAIVPTSTSTSINSAHQYHHSLIIMAASLTEEARKQANLRLLQRSIDKSIVDIVGSATHVVLYEYQNPQGWEKSQVEGSLFLVAQTSAGSSQNRYSLAILNRHSTENFQVAVTRDFQLQHKEPYLIFKETHKILGIWFHSSNERVVMASLLNQLIYNLQNNVAAPAAVSAPPQPQPPSAWGGAAAAARSGASPLAQQLPPAGTPAASRPPAAHAESPSQLIEPLMNSLLSPLVDATTNQQQLPPRQTTSSSESETPNRGTIPPGVALDKKSLQLALLSLIQDERFIDLLHAQYLKVAHARARNNKK
jgi:mRNA-decapping enzyme 1B